MHDDMQAMRIHQMTKCLKDGQIPCRWVPDMGYGYGYPQFNFYPPFPYYFMTAFHLVGVPIIDSVKIGFIATFIISGLGMYLLSRSLFGHWGGLLSSFLYLYAPYRAMNVFVRGAMGEIWAMAILPWVMYFMYRLAKQVTLPNAIGLGLMVSLLALSHLLSLLMFLPLGIVWGLWLLTRSNHKLQYLWYTVLSGIIGFGLSSFYLLPAIFEQKYVHIETMLMGYFSYYNHFASVSQLLLNPFWGFGSSLVGPYEEMSLYIGIIHWILPILTVYILFRYKYLPIHLFQISIILVLVYWSYIFLIHPRSILIWQFLPFLSWLQFPWRFLAIASLIGSLIAGGILIQHRFKLLTIIIIFIPILILNINYFRARTWFDINDQAKFSGLSWTKQQTISIFDYLPKSAPNPPTQPAPSQPFSYEQAIEVSNLSTNSYKYTFQTTLSQSDDIYIPIFNFPGWYVESNNVPIPTSNGPNGEIVINLPSGTHNITAIFRNTPVRIFANGLSSLTIILVILLYIKHLKHITISINKPKL